MAFETALTVASPESFDTPFLAVVLPQGDLPQSLAALDRATGGALSRVIAAGDFKGKKDEVALLYPERQPARVLLIGVGKAEDVTRTQLRRAAGIAAKRARTLGAPTAALWYTSESRGKVSWREVAQVAAEGALQGAWYFGEMKRPPEEPKPPLERLTILMGSDAEAEMTAGHRVGSAIGAGHVAARGLQVLPGNLCTPEYLGKAAIELAARFALTATVLDGKQILAEGMHALLAVAQGSALDPRFIVLEYSGAPKSSRPVVLIGKGVTFDTGGISIKPAQGMEDMKFDMSGAAAVLGTFEMLGRLKPKVNVVGLIPSAENMPSGTAYKPGDVVKSHFGKTIEVVNTDAEGRLLLADALSYARRFDPACVLDIATLTGAILISLGNIAAGVMGTDSALVQEVIAAGARAAERAWELPLWDEYRDLIKSDIADMKNSGGRNAGSITAAWFLREFVEGFPWAHLDIAGMDNIDRDDPAMVKGPTGVGVRLFSEFVLGRAVA
ncbi:MAG: leucyl aminopeptidase [Gemmatimonadota bacterium]